MAFQQTIHAVPTLTLSTNLLIEEYVNGGYIGTDESPSVTCMPSNTRAPVRWRSMFGVYGELPDDYQAFLSPSGLNHTLTFPSSYNTTPSRTEFFICDLINAELSNEAEVSPQTVTVRFIQGELITVDHPFAMQHLNYQICSNLTCTCSYSHLSQSYIWCTCPHIVLASCNLL